MVDGRIAVDRLYTVDEVAEMLHTKRRAMVYEIPEDELVPTRVGPKGGKRLYRGRDILRYMDLCRATPLGEG